MTHHDDPAPTLTAANANPSGATEARAAVLAIAGLSGEVCAARLLAANDDRAPLAE